MGEGSGDVKRPGGRGTGRGEGEREEKPELTSPSTPPSLGRRGTRRETDMLSPEITEIEGIVGFDKDLSTIDPESVRVTPCVTPVRFLVKGTGMSLFEREDGGAGAVRDD